MQTAKTELYEPDGLVIMYSNKKKVSKLSSTPENLYKIE